MAEGLNIAWARQKLLELSHPFMWEWSILLTYRGSVAHGMWMPPTDPMGTDDIDIMGVMVPPIEFYFGLQKFGRDGTKQEAVGEWDVVFYELRKMFRLLIKGNPNVLQTLWVEPKHIIHVTPPGQTLIASRGIFSTRATYRAFTGYALGQLHRMERGSPSGYMGEKRKAILEQFGYDTKNAAHLIRLLRMGIEFLEDGVLRVDRSEIDAEELLAIKRGEWSLAEVQKESERLMPAAERAFSQSRLPDQVDMDFVNRFCACLVAEALDLEKAI